MSAGDKQRSVACVRVDFICNNRANQARELNIKSHKMSKATNLLHYSACSKRRIHDER